MKILLGMWRLSARGWWWAAPFAYLAAWGVPELVVRQAHMAETPAVRAARVACFCAAAALLLVLDRKRRPKPLRYVYDPQDGRVSKLPWTDRFLAVTLAQWAWLALPLAGWALVRVVA